MPKRNRLQGSGRSPAVRSRPPVFKILAMSLSHSHICTVHLPHWPLSKSVAWESKEATVCVCDYHESLDVQSAWQP